MMSGAWRVFTPTPIAFAGRVSQWGLAVSRSFGDLPLKDPMKLLSVVPETQVLELDEDCLQVVFACDGIWDVMSNEDVQRLVVQNGGRSCLEPYASADLVTKTSYGKSSEDNLTTLSVKLTFETPGAEIDQDDDQPRSAKRRRVSS